MILRRRIMKPSGGGDTGDYVDFGLPSGLLWARGNIVIDGSGYAIGAETDRGCFFSWGNIVGHEPDGSYSFTSTNYNATSGSSLRAAIPSNDAQHDAALACLGEPWHLATTEAYQELIANTDSEWVSNFNGSGVNGYKFMKKTNHSVYIFMPASGWQQGSASSEYNVRGEYFASTYYSNAVATNMTFTSSELNSSYTNSSYGAMRRHGKPVRAVHKPIYSITITFSSSDGSSAAGITVVVTDHIGNEYTGTTDSNGVVQINDVLQGTCSVKATGYRINNKTISVSASRRSFAYTVFTTGVWAYYSDGTARSYADADSNAIGVAVVSADCGFVIDKTDVGSLGFGGYNTDLSSIGVMVTTNETNAKTDFDGNGNTTKLISAIQGVGTAAISCRNTFGGVGYLGSAGEWNAAATNKSDIVSMMAKIGGTALLDDSYWTSTLYNSTTSSWRIVWPDGVYASNGRNINRNVRAFRAL